MKKILRYEVIKLVMAFGSAFFLFSLVPLSLYVLLLPVDILGWILISPRISVYTWVGISIIFYLVVVIACLAWILTNHTGLEFLLDVDWMR